MRSQMWLSFSQEVDINTPFLNSSFNFVVLLFIKFVFASVRCLRVLAVGRCVCSSMTHLVTNTLYRNCHFTFVVLLLVKFDIVLANCLQSAAPSA